MTPEQIKKDKEVYKKAIEKARNQSTLETIALKQLKKMGLQLFKTTRVHSGWEQLTMDVDSINSEDPQLGTPISCN